MMGKDNRKGIPVILDDRSMQFRWLDSIVYPSQEFTLDYVSRKNVVRLQFNTEKDFNLAKGGDLIGVYLCDRFFDKNFSERSRRSLLWSNFDPNTLCKYQDFDGQKLIEKSVELKLWLPHRVAARDGLFSMFKKSERYNLVTEYPTDLGRLLKGFQDFINDAGWEGETLYPEKRIKDARGEFAAKYGWVVLCDPPDHLYQINWIAELEGQDDQQTNAVGLRNVHLLKKHSHIHKQCLMQIKLSQPHSTSSLEHDTKMKRIAEEAEEKHKSLRDALLGKITVAQVCKGVSNEKLSELVRVEATKVIAELGWGDGNNTVKGRRMDCMRKPYKERVKIIALVLRHLSGIGQPRKKLAKEAKVSESTFKRLTKRVRATKVAKGLTQEFSQIARDSLDISVRSAD